MDPTVDALRLDDIETARSTAPAEKLRQALDLMAVGLAWKRAALMRRHPGASAEEIDALFQQWLCAGD